MKLWLSISCAILLSLAACQNKDSGGSAPAPAALANYATTPQPCNAQQILPGCIPQYGQQIPQQWPSGSWYWPQQWQPSQGYCGCPSGYAPVYSQGAGMACAPYAYFTQQSVVYYNWNVNNGQPQNGQWLNAPQDQYNTNNTNSQCYNQTAQGCDVRLNNCPSGTMCQPVSGGSTIGLCVRGP
jgi:hypothetical protein